MTQESESAYNTVWSEFMVRERMVPLGPASTILEWMVLVLRP